MGRWMVPGYADTRELAENASGRTVLASHAATGLPVTIKYLGEERRHDEAYLTRYRDQARRLAGVDSANVAALYEYVEGDEGTATVREYVEGVPLASLLAADGPLSPESAVTVLKGVLLGLGAGHGAGAVHGDVTPANVLIDTAGQIKVSDFAVATGPGSAAGDAAAAVAAFVEAATGTAAATAAPDRAPKKLRGVLRAVTLAAPTTTAPAEPDAVTIGSDALTAEPGGITTLPDPATVEPAASAGVQPDPPATESDLATTGLDPSATGLDPSATEPEAPTGVLLAQLEAEARKAFGEGWELRGRERLAKLVVRQVRRSAR